MAAKARSQTKPTPSVRRRFSMFAAALFAVMSAFTLGAAAISVLGSAEDGAPRYTLRLTPGTPAYADDTGLDTDAGDEADAHTGLPDDPISAFAAPVPPINGRIRVAILVTGFGLSETQSRAAIAALPQGTTISFSPYARNVQALVDEARRRNIEVLLETALEPFDYPDNDPGPYTLLTGLSPAENEARLDWMLGRFRGFPGVVAVSGGRFLASPDAARPFLELLKARGLYFVDAASNQPALVLRNADEIGVPAIARSVVLDEFLDASAVDGALARLGDHAQAEGTALGTTSLYPAMVSRLAAWSEGLEARGLVLVPVSALARPAIN